MKRKTGRRRSKRHRVATFLSLAVLATVLWTLWGNTALTRSDVSVSSQRLPHEFDGFVIAQISDLHDAVLGEENGDVVETVLAAKPDLIVLTGDMVDARRGDIARSVSLIAKLVQIAPTYYVNGNHEAALTWNEYHSFTKAMKEAGARVLEDECVYLSRGNASIRLIGLNDLGFIKGSVSEKIGALETSLGNLMQWDDCFTLVLAHRPELIESYAACGADVVFCGHAHGGQVRLPLLGGVYSPGQGFFPKYDAGLFISGSTQMVVSRGIGNSNFPLRFNNRPEVVIVTLKTR